MIVTENRASGDKLSDHLGQVLRWVGVEPVTGGHPEGFTRLLGAASHVCSSLTWHCQSTGSPPPLLTTVVKGLIDEAAQLDRGAWPQDH